MADTRPVRPYLDPYDNAFANGPVFERPASAEAARALFDRPEDGDRLLEVFESFERGMRGGEGLRLGLRARLVAPPGQGRVRIGRNCAVRGVLRCEGAGELVIGDEAYVGDDVILSAQARIEIGEGALLAHGVQVFDNDTHPLDADARAAQFRAIMKLGPKGARPEDFAVGHAPVRIGKRCWLGFNCAVMKGANIGDEAIVAAGAVVTSDVPGRSIVAGNPAKVVRSLDAPTGARRGGLFGLF